MSKQRAKEMGCVVHETNAIEEIKSLPGQSRFGVDALVKYLEPLVNGDDCFPLKSKAFCFCIIFFSFKVYFLHCD